MAYLLENETKKIVEDVLHRKEFYQLKPHEHHQHQTDLEKTIIPRFMLNHLIAAGNYLQFHSYQLFVSNYINPNTIYSRLLVKWETGVGKTIASLAMAMNFIQYFQREDAMGSSTVGSVFVIGFTESIFKTELLRFPEFGFISRSELSQLNMLKKLAYSGSKFDIEKLQEFMIKIKKRFGNRKNMGFFKFIGYKKLVNVIFNITDPNLSLNTLDEDGILMAIKDGRIKPNLELLDQFKNSIIICDEIHNVYNSLDKNNWGVAIQYILNYHPSVRAVFMSATPLNNNPTEIIDLMNLLLPKTHYPNRLSKGDFFDGNKQLKRGALDRIADLCKGRISYLRDVNPKYFPSRTFVGENIKGAPYLKFIRCPMSEFHYNTYKFAYTGALNPDSQYLSDFALPNPKDTKIGLYQTSEVKKELPYASQQWKDANKINYRKDLVQGDILRRENIEKISNKFAKMIDHIKHVVDTSGGKIFIYHNIIIMSGVLFIQETLMQNFIISEDGNSNGNTLCSVCGRQRKDHSILELKTGGSIDGKYETIHNTTTGLYEMYLDTKVAIQDRIPLLEYRTHEGVIIIYGHHINNDSNAIEAIKHLNADRVLIRAHAKNMETRKICSKVAELSIFYKKGDLVYYNLGMPKMSKSDRVNYIQNLELHIAKDGKIGGRNRRKNTSKQSVDVSKSKRQDIQHTFMPVRFVVVHSNLDKSTIHTSLERYNSVDNSEGHRYMILVGGKLIKEAHDIKAVREIMIMGRPDNIPTLIQIIGRGIRKGSHKYLPVDKHNVNVRIYTSALPVKDKNTGQLTLSYEEEKYVEKLGHYKIIQNIEKTLHENAVDSFINKDIIWTPEEQKLFRSNKKENELGPLYFEPNLPSKITNKTFKLNELNLETFSAFHAQDEVNRNIMIIKRLFIEKSPVWTYKDLLHACKNPHFAVEANTQLISENLFIVALTRLVWIKNSQYVEPIITTVNEQINGVIDKLYDPDDKIILLPGDQKSVITQIGEFYILFPVDSTTNEPIKGVESPYRINIKKKPIVIDIREFLESGVSLIKYEDKRDRFFTKWNNVAIDHLEMAVCDFGTDFHSLFLEECIEYVFNVWTDNKLKKSIMHAFYFKMLNYYDLRKLVIWGHTLKPYMFKKYEKYLMPISVKLKSNTKQKLEEVKIKEKDMSTSGLINLLKSSINKSDLHWVSSGLKKQFEDNLGNSLKLFDGNYKKKSPDKKIAADVVPVGHFLMYIPKFYHPVDDWFESPEYLDSMESFVENSTIIGYDERSKTGVHIRFKIRTPIQNIKQFKDSRLIEKGSVCSSKSKVYLKEIAGKLGIKLKGKINVNNLCNDIRTKLIYLELKERVGNTKKKWFYFIYERRPEIIIDDRK
jgi:hypothetical protein